jgi:phytoene synthase
VLAVLRCEARGHLDRVCAAIAGLPPQLIPAMLPLAMVRWFLASAEREHADPLRPPLPSRLVVLWKLWRAAGNPRRI